MPDKPSTPSDPKQGKQPQPYKNPRNIVIWVIALCLVGFFLGSQFLSMSQSTVTDTLDTGEFVRAVEQDRVTSVVYAANDYTVNGKYYPAATVVANGNDAVNHDIEATLTGVKDHENQLIVVTGRNSKGYVTSILDTKGMAGGTAAQQALLAENSAGRTDGVWIKPDAAPALESAATVRKHSNSVLQLVGNANGFLTIADGCKVVLVNRDLGTTYDISLNEAIRYSNGVDKGTTEDGTLPTHGMVFELNEYGYVCALYVIDDWNAVKA
jgi:hypothetical protein